MFFLKLERLYGSIPFLHLAILQFLINDISFDIACKKCTDFSDWPELSTFELNEQVCKEWRQPKSFFVHYTE